MICSSIFRKKVFGFFKTIDSKPLYRVIVFGYYDNYCYLWNKFGRVYEELYDCFTQHTSINDLCQQLLKASDYYRY